MPIGIMDCHHSGNPVCAVPIGMTDCNHFWDPVHAMPIGITDCNHSGVLSISYLYLVAASVGWTKYLSQHIPYSSSCPSEGRRTRARTLVSPLAAGRELSQKWLLLGADHGCNV